MCGIAGIIQKTPVEKSIIYAMAQTLIHRGPDYTGYYFDDNVGFLHNRLSLLDLSEKGNQPFIDDELVLLYNGEIYNHLELRKKYLSKFNFISTSDTETLFFLIKKLGVHKTCQEIEGMFAFSIYNRKSKELYLVRDKLGIKPLFFYNNNNKFIFSSELKGITSHFPVKINKLKILSAALGEFEFSKTHTPFENLYQLNPGHILRFSLNDYSQKIEPYFKLVDFVDESEFKRLASKSKNELIEEFKFLFNSSVGKMMLSDVPVGVFVSGGIDSSLIAAVASQKSSINLYTANVEGKYSELKYAKTLSNEINQPLNIHNHFPEDFIHQLVKTTWHYELPIVVHPSAIPFQSVAALAKKDGIKPILTGEGSDELFLGYPRLLTKKWDKVIKLPLNVIQEVYKKIPGLTRYLNLNNLNYNRDLLYMPFNNEKYLDLDDYQSAYSFINNTQKIREHTQSIEMLGRGIHSLLWRNDRMGMMHSLEARFPFLDDSVIKFALNLPIDMKIGKTSSFYNYKHPFLVDKYIVRKSAESILSKKLTSRRKDGFPVYGHMNLEIKPNFFKNGFLQNLCEWSEKERMKFENETENYLKAKLACLEIWGKIVVNNNTENTIQNEICNLLKMRIE